MLNQVDHPQIWHKKVTSVFTSICTVVRTGGVKRTIEEHCLPTQTQFKPTHILRSEGEAGELLQCHAAPGGSWTELGRVRGASPPASTGRPGYLLPGPLAAPSLGIREVIVAIDAGVAIAGFSKNFLVQL
ncbi:hypothetical protein CISG_09380 [Coccidioides immitis RMSCC 3703]|uniref:Uncharacterized protein n=1 Tax=Coccidioides immitis RMSCC 3703 TaxID=454286 RepID=A0A0J8U4T6_COCIT|nr:hypothetical protein CISG_09380 [Coccidioides immitis RMSCC 3703]